MTKPYSKRKHNFSYVIGDLIIVYLSIIISFFVLKRQLYGYVFDYQSFLYIAFYIGTIYLVLNYVFELYKWKETSFFAVAYKVVLVVFFLMVSTVALGFISLTFAYPHRVLLLSTLLQFVFLTCWRQYVSKRYYQAYANKKSVIIGKTHAADVKEKLSTIGLGNIALLYSISPTLHSEELYDAISKNDVVYLAEDVEIEKRRKIIQYCHQIRKPVFFVPSFDDLSLITSDLYPVSDTFVFKVRPFSLDRPSLVVKRFMDVLLSVIGMLFFSIPMLLIALCLKCSGGPVLYKQERVKRGGKHFFIYKFRTMIPNAEAKTGPTLAGEKDTRITRLGHILRATRMDELPQMLNVLKGDMSIVGPRPERPFFVDQYIKEIPEYNFRHRVKPGLTGMAQVRGRYNTVVRDKLKFDLMYINTYSIALDIKLIFQTLGILLDGESTEGVHKKKK